MNKSAQSLAGEQTRLETQLYPVSHSSRYLTMLAWVVVLLISTLPEIVWIELTASSPTWLTAAKMTLLFGLGVVAFVWQPLRPLRDFFLVMFALFGLMELRLHLNFTWTPLQALFGQTVFDERMQAEQTGKLAVALLMIVTLLILGYRRRDFFLTRGNLWAPIKPVPLLGFPKADPWPQFGLQWGFCIAAALALVQYLLLRPSAETMLAVVPILPSILFYAALNAFNEEVTYRVPMLTTLEPVGGRQLALWLPAYFFGIAHYFGVPGGLVGGLLSIFMGWILGKGMLETRGLFWTWWIHFLSDIAIFTFLTAALL